MNENSIIVNLCVEVWDYYPASFEEISASVSAFLKEEKKACAKGDIKGTNTTKGQLAHKAAQINA